MCEKKIELFEKHRKYCCLCVFDLPSRVVKTNVMLELTFIQ